MFNSEQLGDSCNTFRELGKSVPKASARVAKGRPFPNHRPLGNYPRTAPRIGSRLGPISPLLVIWDGQKGVSRMLPFIRSWYPRRG